MKNFLIKVGINGAALWVAALVVTGFHLADGDSDWQSKLMTILFVALIFGVINAFLKPLATFLALPALVLTLGLFIFVVNAFMLQLTEWLSGPLGIDFTIDAFFWDAVMAAVVMTLVSWALSVVLPDGKDD